MHYGAAASLYSSRGQRKYLTPAERQRFIAAANLHPRAEARLFCLTLAYTGCRISECLALTQSSIEPETGYIAIHSLKKRGRIVIREVPTPPVLLADLRNVGPARLWTFSRSRAWQLIKAVMADAGIGSGIHATPKGLRHAFGIHAIRSGVPLNLVQRWLGHSRMETTAIYLNAIGPEELELAARMWTHVEPTGCITAPGRT